MSLNDNAKRLVAALRSGDYKQTRERLRDENGFCCLGVACDLFDPTKWDEDMTYERSSMTLPPNVQDFFGFTYENGAFHEDGVDGLANRNDDGATFAEIADLIESEPPGLFRKGATS